MMGNAKDDIRVDRNSESGRRQRRASSQDLLSKARALGWSLEEEQHLLEVYGAAVRIDQSGPSLAASRSRPEDPA